MSVLGCLGGTIFVVVFFFSDIFCAFWILQKLRLLTLPSRRWGPALVKHRELIDYVHGFVYDPDKEEGYLNKGYSWSSIISSQVCKTFYAERPLKGILANTVDPDQTPQNEASVQGLQILH